MLNLQPSPRGSPRVQRSGGGAVAALIASRRLWPLPRCYISGLVGSPAGRGHGLMCWIMPAHGVGLWLDPACGSGQCARSRGSQIWQLGCVGESVHAHEPIPAHKMQPIHWSGATHPACGAGRLSITGVKGCRYRGSAHLQVQK